MKTDIFKLSFMALAVTAFMVSCTQDGDLVNTADTNNKVLKVATTVKDFRPDANTRVADEADPENGNNYITKFEEGDKMGVYAFTDDGTVMCKNLPMTYTVDGKWASDSPLYFYKNATYIAYSPYNANISNVELTNENAISAITNYFVTTVFTDASKNYSECDLMTASAVTDNNLPEADASAITFNFAHAMSMVEFIIPVKNYKSLTTGYEYSGPVFDVKLQKQEGAGAKVDVTALALGKGVYRSLLAPVAADVADKDMTFHGEMMVGDGTQPVYFSTQTAFKPEAGKYKKVTVSYTNSPDPAVGERDLKVGDYYYSDGGIVPVETNVADVPKKNLVGLVFSLTTSAEDQARGWKQGYVVAIKTVLAKWGAGAATEYLNKDDADAKTAFIANMNGYDMTVEMRKVQGNSDNICTALSSFEPKLTIGTISGWYCPSPGQLVAVLENLGGYIPSDSEDYLTHNNSRSSAVTALNTRMQSIVGDSSSDFGEFTWSAAESSANNAWSLQCKTWGGSGAWVGISDSRQKNAKQLPLRPVLAF